MCWCNIKENSMIFFSLLVIFINSVKSTQIKYADGRCIENDGKTFFRTNDGFLQCNVKICPRKEVGPYPLCHICCAYETKLDEDSICLNKWLVYIMPFGICLVVGFFVAVVMIYRSSIIMVIRNKIFHLQSSKHRSVEYDAILDKQSDNTSNKEEGKDKQDEICVELGDDHIQGQNDVDTQVQNNVDTQVQNDSQIESSIQCQTDVVMTTNMLNNLPTTSM